MAEISPVSAYLGSTRAHHQLEAANRVLGLCIIIICVETAVLTGVLAAWLT